MINVNGGYLYKLLSISYPTFTLKSANSPIRICQLSTCEDTAVKKIIAYFSTTYT